MEDERREDFEAARAARERELRVRALLRQALEPDAFERLSRIRVADSGLYEKLAAILSRVLESGKLGERISDEQLKKFVSGLLEKKVESRITFERK